MGHQLIVIGAGPAGLLAALRAAELGRSVLLLEKAAKPGVKILVSGGTRCNVANQADRGETLKLFGHARRFLRPAFGALFRDDVLALLDAEGVPTKLEPTGKFFPVSDRAVDVQRALVGRALRAGVELRLNSPVLGLERVDDRLRVQLADAQLTAPHVLLCSGGQSYPRTGTTGDGYRFAESLGHTIVPTRPALAPLAIPEPWLHALRGIALPAVHARLMNGDRRLAERTGDLLFTHFGLSGPVAMDLSSDLARHPQANGVQLDLTPGIDRRQQLIDAAGQGNRLVRKVLDLPARLSAALLAHCEIPQDRRGAELSKPERTRLVNAITQLWLPLSGSMGYDRAEVTAGGVSLDEVNPKTMASRLVPGLYLAGEVLDIDGPIGGFNFQAAFSTGHLAGTSASA